MFLQNKHAWLEMQLVLLMEIGYWVQEMKAFLWVEGSVLLMVILMVILMVVPMVIP